ncbi:M48 family metalloprotease [Roseburia hominis]
MFCQNCGKEVQSDDRFCWNCGVEIGKALQSQEMTAEFREEKEENGVPDGENVLKKVGFSESSQEKVVVSSSNDMENRAADKGHEDYDYEKLPTEKPQGIHNIYVIDFFIRMLDKSNIPLFIYLIINVVIIGIIATLFCALPIGWGIAVGFLLYLASVSVALSPIGEWMLRRQTGCVKIDDKDVIDRLEPIFREVYYKAKKANPMISSDVRLFINDDEAPNAFATGRKTVCVTRGLLAMDDEQIRATLGHEFGHLSHKDTDRILVVSVGNTVITAIMMLFQIGVIIGDVIMQIVAMFTGDDEGFFISILSAISRVITLVLIRGFMKVWSALGVALCMKTSRGNEYLADAFSFKLGYGDGLCAMLSALGGGEKPQGLFANLASSHPASVDRIARLQEMKNTQSIEG